MIISILAYAGLNIASRDITFIRDSIIGEYTKQTKVESELERELEKREREIKSEIREKRDAIKKVLKENAEIKINDNDGEVKIEKKIGNDTQIIERRGLNVKEKTKLLEQEKERGREEIKEIRNEVLELQREKKDLLEEKRGILIDKRNDEKYENLSGNKKTKVSIVGIPIFTFGQIVYREVRSYRILPGSIDKYSHYIFSVLFQGFFNALFFDNWKIIFFDSMLVSASIFIGNSAKEWENKKR